MTVERGELEQRQRVADPRAEPKPPQPPQHVQPAEPGEQTGEHDHRPAEPAPGEQRDAPQDQRHLIQGTGHTSPECVHRFRVRGCPAPRASGAAARVGVGRLDPAAAGAGWPAAPGRKRTGRGPDTAGRTWPAFRRVSACIARQNRSTPRRMPRTARRPVLLRTDPAAGPDLPHPAPSSARGDRNRRVRDRRRTRRAGQLLWARHEPPAERTAWKNAVGEPCSDLLFSPPGAPSRAGCARGDRRQPEGTERSSRHDRSAGRRRETRCRARTGARSAPGSP